MFKRVSIAASLIVALALIVGGCTGAKKAPSATPASTAQKPPAQKPPLAVPASFGSTTDKKAFAIKAVNDSYYAEAKPLLEQVVAVAPDSETYSQLGTTCYNVKDFAGAIEAWTKAADLTPSMLGEMENNIGNALRDSRKLPEAEAAYRKALQAEPTRWTAAINLATMLNGEKKTDEAVAVLQQAQTANKDIRVLSTLLASIQNKTATP